MEVVWTVAAMAAAAWGLHPADVAMEKEAAASGALQAATEASAAEMGVGEHVVATMGELMGMAEETQVEISVLGPERRVQGMVAAEMAAAAGEMVATEPFQEGMVVVTAEGETAGAEQEVV